MDGLDLSKEQMTALNVVAAANNTFTTDFKITLGKFEFKVLATVMAKASPYFAVLCNGNFQEAASREVHLKGDDPIDFARLLQFIYAGEYDREPGDSKASKLLPLDSFISPRELMREGWGVEGIKDPQGALTIARDKDAIDKSLWWLADKYDVPSLRKFIATNMVLALPQSFDPWRGAVEVTFAEFQVEFVEVFHFIKGDLHIMPEVNRYLVDELLNFWTRQHDATTKTIPPLLGPVAADDVGVRDIAGLLDFREQLKKFVEENGSFAYELTLGMQRIAMAGLKNFKWSDTRIRNLRERTHVRAGPGRLTTS